jgi:hypothetical protein
MKEKSKFKLETFSVSEEDHPKLKASMHAAARVAVAAFPKTLELVKDQLRRHDPIGIMACFAGYGLITSVGSREGSKKKPLKDIGQHRHCSNETDPAHRLQGCDDLGKGPFGHLVTDRLLQTLDTLALLAHRPQSSF